MGSKINDSSPEGKDLPPQVLEFTPVEDKPDRVVVTLNKATRGVDLLATLMYAYPTEEKRREVGREILGLFIGRGYLKFGKVWLSDELGDGSGQVEATRRVRLVMGAEPTVESIEARLGQIYRPEEIPERLEQVMLEVANKDLIDPPMPVEITQRNELVDMSDEAIAYAMVDLAYHDKFGTHEL